MNSKSSVEQIADAIAKARTFGDLLKARRLMDETELSLEDCTSLQLALTKRENTIIQLYQTVPA